MERLKQRLESAKQALNSLQETLNMPYSKVVRDASIQRFEFTLEACWKLAQHFLYLREGLDLGSPKSVMRGCFQIGLLDENETTIMLEMISDRNLTVHTYNEELADKIFQHLKKYYNQMKLLTGKIESKL